MEFSRPEYWRGSCSLLQGIFPAQESNQGLPHCRQILYQLSYQESPYSKEIKPVNPKGNQPWIFIGKNDAEAEAPILWPPDVKNWLIGKDPDAGNDWGQEEKGVTENEMAGWHHWLDGHGFERTLGDHEGQGSLECCSPRGHRVRHDWVTEQQPVGQNTHPWSLLHNTYPCICYILYNLKNMYCDSNNKRPLNKLANK